ncbi:MAG: hypothetical protein AAGJ40_02895 [Planctomycetota bacterium]
MTIHRVNRMWSRDSFDVQSLDGLRKRAGIVEGHQIECDPDTTELELAADSRVPATGSLWKTTQQIRCKRRNFVRVSPVLWMAILNFEGEYGPEGPNDTPLNSPPIKKWTDIETDAPIDEDINGKAIVTKTGEPIDGVTMKIADNVLTVQRNYQVFSPFLTSQYRHSVNSDNFDGYPPGMARLTGFSAEEVWDEAAGGYWTVSASIQFREPYRTTPERAWWARVRHEGYYCYSPDTRKKVKCIDKHREEVSRPELLDEDGFQIKDDEENGILARDQAIWLEFPLYKPLPYAALGLLDG